MGPAEELLSIQKRAITLPHIAVSWEHVSEWLHKPGAGSWQAETLCKLYGQCDILLQCCYIWDQAWWVVYTVSCSTRSPFYLVCPDVLSLIGELLFQKMGVVHRITYSFSFFLLITLFIHFILDIKW